MPMARVPANENWIIQQVLDAGAMGVIFPMINTAEECKRFVQAAKYPPIGRRSFGPARGLLLHADYVAVANRKTAIWAMVETVQAIKSISEIAGDEGLHGVYIGPSHLSMEIEGSIKNPISQNVTSEITKAIQRVNDVSRDLSIGIFCPDVEFARQMISAGCNLITVKNDAGLIKYAAIEAFREIGIPLKTDSVCS